MTETLSSFATLVVIHYPSRSALEALARMAFDPGVLRRTPGILFAKLGGSGGGLGFSPVPDWKRYVLFTTWDSEKAWHDFLTDSPVSRRWRRSAREFWWMTLRPQASRGSWDGRVLFHGDGGPAPGGPVLPDRERRFDQAGAAELGGPVAVLTRAQLRPSRLVPFWSEVGAVSARLGQTPGLILSTGFGELPWIRQATFSVWQTPAAFDAFAYGSEEHRRVIRKTREEGWYAEELFARFSPLASGGTWSGKDPCENAFHGRRNE